MWYSSTVDVTERRLCLVFPVDELQVDGCRRAQQAMSFGLDISSKRTYANVELLNELQKKQKHRHVSLDIDTLSASISVFIQKPNFFSRATENWYASSGH